MNPNTTPHTTTLHYTQKKKTTTPTTTNTEQTEKERKKKAYLPWSGMGMGWLLFFGCEVVYDAF